LLVKKDFQGGLLGKGGEVDRGGRGDELKVPGDRRATDACQGAAEDELECFSFDFWVFEIVAKVVKDGSGHIGGEWPCLVTGPKGGFFDRKDQPGLVEAGRGCARDGYQGQELRDIFFSGHRDFLLR